MVPWARWLLGSRRDVVLTATTTLALSVGVLTLAMLWIGLFSLRIDWRGAALICLGASGIGWIFVRGSAPADLSGAGDIAAPSRNRRAGLRWVCWLAIAVILGMAALIVFNAVYWPFAIDDAIAIYAWYGKQIAHTGALPVGDLYETYPMMIPLAYAFTHQAAGWIDEGLAGLIPALLSVGVLGAAYTLGKTLYNGHTGLIAALLIALVPMFTHWASAGYTDLPAGFFYGLAAVFCARLAKDGRWQDALLAGIMAGLAAWAKNSGLLIILSIGAWRAYRVLFLRQPPRIGQVALIGAGFALVAAPWYGHNLAMAGVIVPPTGWTWLAQRTLSSLAPYLADSRYLPVGIVFTIGLLLALWRSIARRETGSGLLIAFYVPFFAVWWALFSYDGRFLLALTALAGVMGARLLAALVSPSDPLHFRSGFILSLAILVLAIPPALAAVDHKPELLRNPLMSLYEKHRIRLGPRYDMALYLQTLPAGARVWTNDGLLAYHADGVHVIHGGTPTPDQRDDYDFLAAQPGSAVPLDVIPATLIYEVAGYRLYRVERNSAGNRVGVHLLLDDGRNHWPESRWREHIQAAAETVGAWGYVVQLVRADDLDTAKWGRFMALCSEFRLTPVLRLATIFDRQQGRWTAPQPDPDGTYRTVAAQYAQFVAALPWPTDAHYVIVGNEPNHGDEWGGKPDPAAYARFLIDVADALHAADPKAQVLNAGFDPYAPHTGDQPFTPGGNYFMDADSFIDGMFAAQPDVFRYIDLWASHAYPAGPFAAPPDVQTLQIDWMHAPLPPGKYRQPPGVYNRGINSYRWELFRLAGYGVRGLRVMITETGWRKRESTHANALDSGGPTLPAQTAAEYLDLALNGNGGRYPHHPESGWLPWLADPNVIGVAVFALDGLPAEWGHSNLLRLDADGAIQGRYPAAGILAQTAVKSFQRPH